MTFPMILLQATPLSSLSNVIFPLLIFAVFYFIIMRPQIKKQKEQQNFINNLAAGAEVVTSAGIIGKVSKIEGNVVTLIVDEKTKIRILKQTIASEFNG